MKTHLEEMVFEKAERDDDDDDINIRELYYLQKYFDNWIINWLTDTASLSFYCPLNVTWLW